MVKQIPIRCRGNRYLPYHEFKSFQGNLKKISKENFQKLRAQILKHGWVAPIFVWGGDKIVDGHGRLLVLNALLKEGYTIDALPVVDIEAKNKKEAGQMLLAINSHYQNITGEGLFEFMQEIEIDLSDLSDLTLPDINIEQFKIDFFEDLKEKKEDKFSWRPNLGQISKDIINKTVEDLILKDEDRKAFEKIKTIFVQYSGGRDSTVALWWASKNFPEKRIIAVYSKMEAEFPAMDVFVEDVTAFLKVELKVVYPRKRWWAWIRDKGWPSVIFRPCQNIFLHAPVNEFLKDFDSETTLLLDGSRAGQAGRGSKKTKDSKIPGLEEYQAYHPVFDLKEEAIWGVIQKERMPIWKGYQQGFVRSACWCCPGQCSLQAAMLQKHYPGLCEEIRYWENRLK